MLETEVQESVVEVQESQAEAGTAVQVTLVAVPQATSVAATTEAYVAELKAELETARARYRSIGKAVASTGEVTACLVDMSTDMTGHGLRWVKIGNDIRKQEQAHDATALMHALFVLDTKPWDEKDTKFMDHMMKCRDHMTYRRVKRGQFSFENIKGNEVCEVTTVQHGEVCEVTFADIGRKSRHRQKRQVSSLTVDSTQDQGA